MEQTTISLLTPVINLIIVAIGAYLTKAIVKLVPIVIDFIVAKIGLTNYTKLQSVSGDVYKAIEEDGRLGKLVDSKIKTFETVIKTKFPSITNDEIDLIRQALAGEYNKDKALVVQAVETPIVTAIPIKKYYDENGVELTQVTVTATV